MRGTLAPGTKVETRVIGDDPLNRPTGVFGTIVRHVKSKSRGEAYMVQAGAYKATYSLNELIVTRDMPLDANVEDDQLVIRIGIDTLKFSAEFGPVFYDYDRHQASNGPYVKILDARVLAEDVIRELLREKEDGSSPLSDMLDEALVAAMEEGGEAFDYGDDQ